MDIAEYKRRYGESDDAAPGWDAIDARLREVYGEQEPRHWGSLIKYILGGPDPLDGISAYECESGGKPHLHFCTYGYSSLYYDEESVGAECSKFGFEMTFRLATPLPPTEEPNWVLNLLNNLARYVFKSGRWFEPYHWIPANGPIRVDYPTDLVGLAFALDPALAPIDTPHGRVEFIQAFGITANELERLKSKAATCEQVIEGHRRSNPLMVTELDRQDAEPAAAPDPAT
ncbi:suppressor of fused domain protein [Frigoriglobus tundricola]|uniref:Suppressor of fused domain protein n=1 Tax=Frigoriglobus tundricola TaxID=2774151 RepID=A0A6M5Z069_9BACT|nr:suppressor of fused domain protein [Frigoriglobus tundricola]QJW98592.1 Suppressor of fused domain protein [Frigoriglobus tundricola]